MIFRLLCLYLLCFIALPLYGQQAYNISVNHYNLEDGLSHNQIRWLHKDHRGMMWIGAGNGINRYDGEEFKLVAELNFIDTKNRKILEDYEGDLWLLTDYHKKELIFFNTHTAQVKSFEEKFGRPTVFSKENYADAIMLADSTIIIKTKTHQLLSYDLDKNFKALDIDVDQISSLRSIPASVNFWMQTPILKDTIAGLFIYFQRQADGTFQRQATQKVKRADKALGITKDHALIFWNQEEQHTYTVLEKSGQQKTYPFPQEISSAYYPSIAYDQKLDRFVMLHDGQVSIMSKGEESILYRSNSYKDLIAKQVNFELYRDDIFWVGGFYGLTEVRVKPSPFKRTEYKDPVFHTRPEFHSVRFIDMLIPHISIGWPSSIHRNDSNYWTHFKDKNNRTWLGGFSGIYYIDPENIQPIRIKPENELAKYATGRPYQFFKDQQKECWVPSENGLFKLDINSKKITARYASDHDSDFYLPSSDFRHMHQDQAGIYWIGTFNGLIRWDKANAQHRLYTTKDGLSNNHIMAVYEDDFGFLWMSSDNGIMQFEKSTERVKVYLPADGITHREFNRGSHYKDEEGNLYFGSLNGITHFHPKDFVDFIDQQPNIPLLLMECSIFSAKNKKQENRLAALQEQKKIVMAPGDRYLKLRFALLDYSNPNSIQYVYDIDGETWNAGRENMLNISGLSYGMHTLTVKGRAGNGLFSKEELNIPIEVLKPFYWQYWFLFTCALLLLSMAYLIQKLRTRALIKRQIELEETVSERTKTIQEQSEKLRQLDKAKSRFLANISHEFRTPLTLILNTLNQEEVDKITKHSQTKKKLNFSPTEVDIMERNAQRLSQLIEQLLDLSTLEAGKMELQESPGDFEFYLRELVSTFKPLAAKKQLQLNFESQLKQVHLNFDRDKIDKIVYNLLSNAIKFTKAEGHINVQLKQDQNNTILEVIDSGIGISEKGITRIFDRFYQVNQAEDFSYEGTGLGLALVKELVGVHGGNIEVESTEGQGTRFKITLPLRRATADLETAKSPALPQVAAIESQSDQATIAMMADPKLPNQPNQDLPILLIIEDNEDLRYHHQKTFAHQYQMISAKDGDIGLEKAFEHIPDLIICDVMMPGKNGYEVCYQLKQDERTNHIPIILLTAKAGQKEKIKGLLVGADDYLTKPYHQHELALRMNNLLAHAALIRKQMTHEMTANNTISYNSKPNQQEQFINKLFEIIEANLDDRNFGIEELAAKVNLSRSQLARKLKALIGETPNHFIRSYRLKRAKALLVEEEGNATSVAYLTGFSTPNYFFKCFKNEFGMTPSQYIEQLQDKI